MSPADTPTPRDPDREPWQAPPGVNSWTVYTLNDGVFPPTLTRFTSLQGDPWDAPVFMCAGVLELKDEGSATQRLEGYPWIVHLTVANRWKGADDRDLLVMAAQSVEYDAKLQGYETYDDAHRDAVDAMEVDPDFPSNNGRENLGSEQLRWLNATLELEVESRERQIRQDERRETLRQIVAGEIPDPRI